MRPGILGPAVVLALLATATPATAQPSAGAADALFNEGRTLLEAGDFARACVKFQDSLAIADALGTRLNLALCMEKLGKVHTALVKFEDAAARGKREDQPDVARVARAHADALRPLVPTITVNPTQPVPGLVLVITRPGVPDHEVAASRPIGLDPTDPADANDRVTISASAPGHAGYTTDPLAVAPGSSQIIVLPALIATGDPIPGPVPAPPRSRKRLYGIAAGVGGVAMIAGSALWARSIRNRVQRRCDAMPTDPCEYTGSDRTKIRYGATGVFVGGLAAIGVGTYLFLTAPSSREAAERTAVVPTMTPDGPGIIVVGHF